MAYLLYDILLCLSTLILVPYYLIRGVRYGKARRGLRERLAWFHQEFLDALPGREVVWVHAVSVGETRAAIPLFKALRKRYPDALLVISNVTETGREMAQAIPEADFCIFFPFDLSWVVRKALKKVQPRLIILVETEIWPNFVREAHRLDIPVMLANGRISDRSFPRYRMGGRLLASILENLSAFCMQTEQDARRIRLLGALSGRVRVTGNLKFDMDLSQNDAFSVAELRTEYHLPEDVFLWVVGSTHAGEEAILTRVYKRLRETHPQLLMVMAPRHPERSRLVVEELEKENLCCVLRTSLPEFERILAPGEVLLVDTIGEMMKLYALADMIFVGGSLVPVGGHNILEASLLKKPVMFGPHMQNFKEITRLVKNAYAGMQVKDEEALYQQMRLLIENPEEAFRLGENGYRLLVENRGATDNTIEEISRQIAD